MLKKIFMLSFALCCLNINAVSFAEDKTQSAEPPQAQSQEQAVSGSQQTTTEPAPQPKLVTAIEVKGNKAISTNIIISKMKSKVNSPYQENVISDDLKRLYLLGYFEDIKIDTEDYKDGIKIIVKVAERPIIEKIIFSGILRLTMKEEKLKGLLKSKEGQYMDYPSLSEDTRTLKKLYEKIGYSQAQINYQADVSKETNKAKVQFNVVENKRIRIKDILVYGNYNFSKNRILKIIKTRRAWLFNAGVLKEEVLKEDIERIKSFYHREGFADVAVDYEVKPDTKKSYLLYVIIKIKEGKKYLVGSIAITGNKDITEKEILKNLKDCVTGKVFSQEALRQDVANIQSLYFDRGYISVQIQEAASLNPSTGRTDITYNIAENEVAYVSKIKIKGNVKTKDVVIRRELRIRPGDRFDGDKLRRSKERLQNLGFFEDLSYDTEDTAIANKKDLIVEVKESKTGTFSFGGGYSTVDRFVGFVEIEQKNFDWLNFPYFTGGGQNLKINASLGSISEGYELSFTNPWVFDYPVSFGLDGYRRKHDKDTDVGYGYNETVTGGDLRLGKEISEYLRVDTTYRYDIIKISDIDSNATNDLKKEQGSNTISSLGLALTYDSRDNVFDTTKGNLVTGSLEGAGLGGNKDFVKFIGRASHYFPFIRNSSLELRGRIGTVAAYGNSDDVPIYERFFAGGSTTIRGYNERKVGPIDGVTKDPLGGESMMVANVEYIYPLFSFLKLAAFCDTGNVWSKVGKIGTGGFKTGAGFGLRIKTPVGPIMLDYGIPFNKEPGEDKKSSGKFHFNMSQGF